MSLLEHGVATQKNKKLFFYISNESVISKSILNEIEGKMYNITKN